MQEGVLVTGYLKGTDAKTKLLSLFLICVALLPLVSIFWEDELGIFKINWIIYPVFLTGVIVSFALRSRISTKFLCLLVLTLLYLILCLFKEGQVETVFRFFLSLIPIALYSYFDGTKRINLRYFWIIYIMAFSVPLYFAYLQYTGVMEFNEFDVVDGEYLGRISGGYSKPMNFIAFLLPIYLYGFYQRLVKKRIFIGWAIIISVLIVIYLIGHRTSLFAFIVIIISSFFRRVTVSIIVNYYRYFFNFFIGFIFLIFFYVLYKQFGVIDIIRGRVPMWEAHATQFLESRIDVVIFGAQEIFLKKEYRFEGIDIFGEVHNNSFRTIIFFGLFGFFAYSLLIRSLVLKINNYGFSEPLKFIVLSSFTYFMLYTITNEPAYYASILWSILIWIFLGRILSSDCEIDIK